jgi:hypothetical protein
MDRSGTTTYWDAFVVPEPVTHVLEEQRLRKYSLYIAMVDVDGKIVEKAVHVVGKPHHGSAANPNVLRDGGGDAYFFPFWFCLGHRGGPYGRPWFLFYPPDALGGFCFECRASEVLEETMAIGLDKLGKVAGIKAFLREATAEK